MIFRNLLFFACFCKNGIFVLNVCFAPWYGVVGWDGRAEGGTRGGYMVPADPPIKPFKYRKIKKSAKTKKTLNKIIFTVTLDI